jgi:hypothetical protein
MDVDWLPEVQMAGEEWKEVTVKRAGRVARGKYRVTDGLVTAATWAGIKTARLGTLPPERLAKRLLHELMTEKRKSKLLGKRQEGDARTPEQGE